MPALSLLFDPRGAIDRPTFWSGLLQLALVSVLVWLGLTRLGVDIGLAVAPIVGDALALWSLVELAHGRAIDDHAMASMIIVAARCYILACLVLKRSRDADLGLGPAVGFGLASLTAHALAGLWLYVIFDQGPETILPMLGDIGAGALIWLIFPPFIGSRESVRFIREGKGALALPG